MLLLEQIIPIFKIATGPPLFMPSQSMICGTLFPEDCIKKKVQLSMKQTHRHREQTCGCQGGGWDGGGKDWEFGISRGKLSYIEWINNKVLLYSTGNYIQYPVINHNG